MKKKIKKNKRTNDNQKSFYFEDYLETNIKQKKISDSSISEDRIYILFFSFCFLIAIFSIKILLISFQEPQFLESKKNSLNFLPLRRDIVDRNGILISRNIINQFDVGGDISLSSSNDNPNFQTENITVLT